MYENLHYSRISCHWYSRSSITLFLLPFHAPPPLTHSPLPNSSSSFPHLCSHGIVVNVHVGLQNYSVLPRLSWWCTLSHRRRSGRHMCRYVLCVFPWSSLHRLYSPLHSSPFTCLPFSFASTPLTPPPSLYTPHSTPLTPHSHSTPLTPYPSLLPKCIALN